MRIEFNPCAPEHCAGVQITAPEIHSILPYRQFSRQIENAHLAPLLLIKSVALKRNVMDLQNITNWHANAQQNRNLDSAGICLNIQL